MPPERQERQGADVCTSIKQISDNAEALGGTTNSFYPTPLTDVQPRFFNKAHPFTTLFLASYARMTQPLLILTMIVNSSLLKRKPFFPLGFKTRVFVWYLAYTSFFSRHLLAMLSLTWLFRVVRGDGEREGNPPNGQNQVENEAVVEAEV